MLEHSLACVLTALVVTAIVQPAHAVIDISGDWADITTGLNNQSLAIGLGTPDNLVLRGNAFPVIVAQDGVNTMMAAARVSDAGGKVVAFNKEAYLHACGQEAAPETALTCRLMVNALRWAAGLAADGSNGTSFRLAMASGVVSSTGLGAIKTAATAMGFTIDFPTGLTSHSLSDLSVLGSGSTRIADVLLTNSYQGYTDTQRANTVAFVQQGAGLVLGGQAWSTGGNITMFNGNQLLAPLNCIQWTGQYGDARSIYVASAPPDPKLFNADMAAQAFFDHLQGTALLPADMLQKVTSNVKTAIESTSFTWATPASSPSAALWASFGSQLDVQLSNTAAGWTCGSVDASSPANKIAVAYMAKRNSDMLPNQVTALPCAATFPGLPGAGATVLPSATVTVNATYAGSYTGPMPPRGGGKWLSTGLWAPAGQPITVTISSSIAAALTGTGKLGVQIGSHSDNISGKSSWCRLPYGVLQRRWFSNAADGNSVTMASGLGGLIYIYTAWGNTQGPMAVTVSGAMQAPFFFKGVTTEEEWRASLRSSPVPWAELGSDKFVYTVPSSAVVNIDNPQAIVDLWDTVLDGYADLTVFSRDRPRAERVVVDCDISAGWMHSGYPIMAYQSEADRLNLPKWIGRDNGWGWFHELGHNHQWSAWTLPNQGEVTCNLYSLWASENIMKVNRTTRYTNRAAEQTAYFASGTFPASFETTTGMYQLMQLQENAGGRLNYTGGWDFWRRFLSRMQQLQGTAAVANDDVKIQTWVVETSNAAGKNLVPFYRLWKFPITADTEAAVAALPAFDFDPTGPCMEECSNCCLPGSLSPTVQEICKQATPEGYTFYSKMDSSSYDITRATVTGDWASAAAACSANPYCLGTLTSGWMKYYLRNTTQWTTGFSDPCQGLLVKQDQSGPKLPSALATPSTIKDGSLCIEVPSSGNRLQLAACTGSAAQLFVAGPAPNSNRIQAASGTTCFDTSGSGTAPGTTVIAYSCHTGNNQKWAVDSVGRLLPRHAMTMCLDTEGSSLAAGSRLILNTCSDAPSQRFFPPAPAAASCTGSVTITNGAFSSCGTTLSGQTCQGACNTGFTGQPVATCTNGNYTVSGSCTPASCSGPVTIDNGTFTCGTKASGQTCSGTCNTGYSGTPVATCTNGVYTVSGSCTPASCSGPVTVDNGAFDQCGTTLNGQTCQGACNTGFTGAPTATCTNGVYTVSGSCTPASCSGPVTIANGAFDQCGTTLSGQTCQGACNTGYTGAPLATCTNGVYTVSGTCTPASCSGPVTIGNGTFTCGTKASGQTCSGTCNTGYSGTPVATCTNGVYTVSGSCTPASCSGTVTVTNGVFSCGTKASGQTCQGTCNTGYTGTPVATCTNGVYTVSGSCEGPIAKPSSLQMKATTLCVAVNGNNTNGQRLVLKACSNLGVQPNSQLWVSSPTPNNKRLQTASTTGTPWCIDVSGGAKRAGSVIILAPCSSALSQQWTQDSSSRFVPAHATAMCLDTASSKTTAGSLYVINRCGTAASQKYTVVPVPARHRRLLA